MAMAMVREADSVLLRDLKKVRQQIDLIDEQIWDTDTRLNLTEICDALIDLMENRCTSNIRVDCENFRRILTTLIDILGRWHRNTITFRDFMVGKVYEVEGARNRGNEKQMIWTGVNCVANATGLIAVFVPGMVVPLMVAGIGGSIVGVTMRIMTDKANKKEFADIMSEIEGNEDYRMISFSDVIIKKQKHFEERRTHLMEKHNFTIREANTITTLQMIIESMLSNLIIRHQQQQGIQEEIASGILSHIGNVLNVILQSSGSRHVFNLADDVLEVSLGTMKFLSFATVAMTFAINFMQLLSETKERAEKVRKVIKMKDKLQSGADSIQFFINTINDINIMIKDHIILMSQSDRDKEMQKLKQQVAEHQQIYEAFRSFLENDPTNRISGRNFDAIDFTDPEEQ